MNIDFLNNIVDNSIMNPNLLELCKELKEQIQIAYTESVTVPEAERLAAKFLGAMLLISEELAIADLDARMRKSGLKAVRAAIYMDNASKTDKKPSDTFLQNIIDMDKIVTQEQQSFDEAEVNRDSLQNYYNIFKEGHIFFRGIAKGNFNG